jgi:hypothetical protein
MQDNQFKAPTIEELLKSYYDQTPVMMRDVPQTPIVENEPPQEPVEQIPQPVVAPQPIIPPKQAVSPEEIQGILASPSQPVPAESPSEAERLQDLLAQSRKSRALTEGLANVSEGIKRAASAYAGRGLTQIKPDVSMEEKMRASAERDFKEGIDEFQASRKLQQEKDAEDARKRMESPESEESQRYREFYAKTLKMDIPENVTAAMLHDKFGALSNLAARGGDNKDNNLAERKFLLDQAKFAFAQTAPKRKEAEMDKKEEQKIKTENRSMRKDLDKAETALQAQIKQLEEANKSFDKFSKGVGPGTGPLATLGGIRKYTNQELEGLDSKFKKIGLDEMVKMFQGMSKAVDSDAERRAFEATQPSITLDDPTNKELLSKKLEAAKSLLAKTKAAKNQFDKTGDFVQQESPSSMLSPKDQQALDWANKNPEDPRSAAIKQKLGM